MAHYKNITHSSTIRYALKYWWNVVKNYDGDVREQDFFDIIYYNLKRDEVASIIKGNFSEKQLGPLINAKSDRLELEKDSIGFMLMRIWNEKSLRKGCRSILKIMRDRISRKLVFGEEDRRFEERFKNLCKFMGLDPVESEILMLTYVRNTSVFDDFPECDGFADRPQYFAMAIDRSYPEVLTALSRKRKLIRYNCINDEYWFNRKELGGVFRRYGRSSPR